VSVCVAVCVCARVCECMSSCVCVCARVHIYSNCRYGAGVPPSNRFFIREERTLSCTFSLERLTQACTLRVVIGARRA